MSVFLHLSRLKKQGIEVRIVMFLSEERQFIPSDK